VLLPLALCAAPAEAAQVDAVSLVVDRSAWTWRHPVPAPGLPVEEPSQVPAGDLAVASDGDPGGRPAKATYLRLDLTPLPAAAEVSALSLSLPVDTAAQSVVPDGVRLVACRLLADFTPGEGTDPATAPKEDCAGAPEGRYDAAAGTWSFALATTAQQWALDRGSNHGVVVRPAPDYALPDGVPFQIVFEGAAQVRAALSFTVPAPAPDVQAVTPPDATGGTAVAAPPSVPLSAGSAPLGDLAPPAAPALAAPPAAAPAAAAVVPAAAARPRPTASATTSPGALAALGAAVLLHLLAVARVVDDTQRPRAFARVERARLDRVRLRAPRATPVVVEQPLPRQVPQPLQGRRPISSATSTVT
jgi:hypothetical protein